MAQYTGKKFISGSADLTIYNNNPKSSSAYSSYGYSVDISLGKFVTETRVNGWSFSNSLLASKSFYYDYTNGQENKKNQLNSIGFGVGKFLHFYKHFNNKLGIYGGPGINANYMISKSFANYLDEKSNHYVSLNLGVSGSMYYQLSNRWWIQASLAYANPISIGYEVVNNYGGTNEGWSKANSFKYNFTPNLTLPSVGLGLRYILK